MADEQILQVHKLMNQAGNNERIVNAFAKAWDILGRFQHPVCSVSGGYDSDIMLDLIWRLDEEKKVRYLWFNDGFEYKAVREHLDFLEKKYDIKIERINPVKPIPQCVKEYGQPFISKHVSMHMRGLQKYGFDWKDEPYEVQLAKYPKCPSYIRWWHNKNKTRAHNIMYNKYLREFLIENPPTFKISEQCCKYAKKFPAARYYRKENIDLTMVGLRKAEGGIRALISNCFTYKEAADEPSIFYPIFWFTNEDKEDYKKKFGVELSDCYTKYGLTRTGCAGCPFNIEVFGDLGKVEPYEPGLVKAAQILFKESYEHTKLYRQFRLDHGWHY